MLRIFPRPLILAALGTALLVGACGAKHGDEDLLASAKAYLAKNEHKAAVIQLKNALQQQPNSPEARFLLGKAMLQSGDPISAEIELQRAFDLKYAPSQVVPLLAKAMAAQGKIREVVNQFGQTTLPEAEGNADLKTTLAVAQNALGRTDQAQAELRAALQAVPSYAPALLFQAQLQAGQRHYDEALKLIDQVIAAAPNNADAWQYKGDALLYGRNDAAGAKGAYEKALGIDPEHVGARSSLVWLLLSQNDFAGATAQVDELRKSPQNRGQTLYFDAQIAYLQQDLAKAGELTQQLVKLAPNSAQALQLVGAVELTRGSLLAAERALSKAVQTAPELPTARRLLAQAYVRLGQAPKAVSTLEPLLNGPQPDAQAFALAAEAYMLMGDSARAAAHFTRAVALNPRDTRSRTSLVLAQPNSSRDATIAALQSIATTDKGTSADLALANIYIRDKDYPHALKAIDGIQAKEPNKPTAANLRAQVYLLTQNRAEARRAFEQANKIDPAFMPAVSGLAGLDYAEKKPEQARKRFEAVLAQDPNNVRAMLALASLRAESGAPAVEIATMLSNAVKANPSEAAPRVQLVEHYLKHKNIPLALTTAQSAVAALPSSPEALDALGRAQWVAKDLNQAISSFNKLAAMIPQSPQPFIRLAGIYLDEKDATAASQALKRALQVTPDLLAAQEPLIDIALAAKRPKEAVEIARSVQKQRADQPIGFMLEAGIEAAQGNYVAAAELYRSVLKRFPSTEPAVKLHSMLLAAGKTSDAQSFATTWQTSHAKDAGFILHLGQVALLNRDYAAAEKRFAAALALEPDNIVGLNNLAWVMTRQNKPGAIAHAQKATELKPDSPDLFDTLALALAAENQVAKALEVEKKALAMAPGEPGLRLTLAKLYIQAGDKSSARTELAALAQLGDKFRAQAEVGALLKSL